MAAEPERDFSPIEEASKDDNESIKAHTKSQEKSQEISTKESKADQKLPSQGTTQGDTTEDDDDDEDDEDETCGFCLFMKGGACKREFVSWQKCVDREKENGNDFVEECIEQIQNLRECMMANPDYYAPMLEEEKKYMEERENEEGGDIEANETSTQNRELTSHTDGQDNAPSDKKEPEGSQTAMG